MWLLTYCVNNALSNPDNCIFGIYWQQSEDDASEIGSSQGGRRESNPSSPVKVLNKRNGSLPSVFPTNGNADLPSKLIRTPSNPQSPHSYITKKESADSSVSAHSNSSGMGFWYIWE